MEKEKKSGGMMSVIAALGANILVAISKFVGFAVSGSAAMLNESIHSIVDCGNEILLLVGLSLIHISEPTRLDVISYAVFCLKKKKRS